MPMSRFEDGVERFDHQDFLLVSQVETPVAALQVSEERTLGNAHCHDFCELTAIINGSGTYCFHEHEYTLHPGDTFLVLPGMVHRYVAQRHLTVLNFIWYPDEFLIPLERFEQLPGYQAFSRLEPHTRSILNFEQRLILSPEEISFVQFYYKRIRQELERHADGYQFACCCIFAELMVELCRLYAAQGSKSESRNRLDNDLFRMEKVLRFLDKNYMNHIGRRDAAAVFGSSQATFTRRFGAIMQESFSDYLLDLRLRHAHSLLLTTDLPVTEIAFRCGFCDSNYFCYRFRKRFDCPPHRFRLHQNGK